MWVLPGSTQPVTQPSSRASAAPGPPRSAVRLEEELRKFGDGKHMVQCWQVLPDGRWQKVDIYVRTSAGKNPLMAKGFMRKAAASGGRAPKPPVDVPGRAVTWEAIPLDKFWQ